MEPNSPQPVEQQSCNKKVIVISGPSGVGKTTIYKKILEEYQQEISFSISATTRTKRDSEIDGRDYHFLSLEEFEYLIAKGDFIEWETVHNNYYGTLNSEIQRIWDEGKHCLLDIDVKGGLRIKKMFGEKSFSVFVSPPSIEELEQRLRSRGTNDEISLKNRLHNATQEMTQKSYYNCVLKNENLENAIEELKKALKQFVL